jgi:transcriptional regulator with PAS, ATPase and Fis domain
MPRRNPGQNLALTPEKVCRATGGRNTIPVDVRIITATDRDVESVITQGRFREDLYYRLKVVSIFYHP